MCYLNENAVPGEKGLWCINGKGYTRGHMDYFLGFIAFSFLSKNFIEMNWNYLIP